MPDITEEPEDVVDDDVSTGFENREILIKNL
jgi:hypothetical protein